MDRKEFLKYSGIMILSLVGITSLLRNALNHTEAFNSKSSTASKTDNIYGKE